VIKNQPKCTREPELWQLKSCGIFPAMKFEVLTLFPEAFESFLSTSIIGRAVAEKLIEVRTWDIREFSENKHKKVM